MFFFQYVEIFKTLAVPHWGCMAIGHLAATGAPVPLTADADAAVPKVEVPRSSLRVLINLSTLYINMCIYIYIILITVCDYIYNYIDYVCNVLYM